MNDRICKKCGAVLYMLLSFWYCTNHDCHYHTNGHP